MFEVTIPKPIAEALMRADGTVIDYEFTTWIFETLGDGFWKEGNANEIAGKLACNVRLQEAFEGKKPGDKVRISDADLEWAIKGAQRFELPQHLGALRAKCMRFISALANAVRVDEAA